MFAIPQGLAAAAAGQTAEDCAVLHYHHFHTDCPSLSKRAATFGNQTAGCQLCGLDGSSIQHCVQLSYSTSNWSCISRGLWVML